MTDEQITSYGGSTIVLCGGQLNRDELPVGVQSSHPMIPVNGRPVIAWILNDLIEKQLHRVTVVIRADDHQLERFLERCYAPRLDLKIVQLAASGSILDSLHVGLEADAAVGPVRIVLGDTLISDPFDAEDDYVYAGPADGVRRWCLVSVDSNGSANHYEDKTPSLDSDLPALAGFYRFADRRQLRACLSECRRRGECELSALLRRYGSLRPISARRVDHWYDFGHIDRLAAARVQLLNSRSFNSLAVDPVVHTVTKTSRNSLKLADELNWYRELPESLKVLTPRLLDSRGDGDEVQITQEYYGYPTLAELFVFGCLSTSVWQSVLHRVLEVHALMARHVGTLSRADIESVYVAKTDERIQALRASDAVWSELLSRPTIMINGQEYDNLPRVLDRTRRLGAALTATARVSVIHGDLCFSNILFDLNSQIVRLIDPRGRFGRRGVFGDPRYDVAKLRHSVAGMYDFIVFDMFTLSETSGGFEIELLQDRHSEVTPLFDDMIVSAGYDLVEIQYIEGLLFASMIPLHADRRSRQVAMYCRAVELLNRVAMHVGTSPAPLNLQTSQR